MHVNDKINVYMYEVQVEQHVLGIGAELILCKGLKVPLCLILLVQIMFHIIWK